MRYLFCVLLLFIGSAGYGVVQPECSGQVKKQRKSRSTLLQQKYEQWVANPCEESRSQFLQSIQDYALAVAISVGLSRPDAEDVSQTTLVRILRSPVEYDRGRGMVSSFIRQIAIRLSYDILRQHALRGENFGLEKFDRASNDPSVQSVLEAHETCANIRKAILEAPLGRTERQIFEDITFGEKSRQEVAEVRRVAEGTIRWHLHQAREILKSFIKL
ncbi:MAG: RNA polymerase sigma factor [Bacteriovoracia bacterium]